MLTGFLNVSIPASSGFILCVTGHSHRKYVLSRAFVFFVFRCSQVAYMFGFLRLDVFFASVAIAIVNRFNPPVLFLSGLGAHIYLKHLDFCFFWICFVRRWP